MGGIKFLSGAIFIVTVFCIMPECKAQFATANNDLLISLATAYTKAESASFIASSLAQKDSAEQRLRLVDKIIFTPVGAFFGTLWGVAIGAAIPHDKMANGIKGGMIGFCVGPFLTYEMFASTRGLKNPLHQFYVKIGGNLTLTNYEDFKIRPGFSIGIGRHYHLSNILGLRGEISYALRRFFLHSQKISYAFYFDRVVKSNNINFSVNYINTAILLNFKLMHLQQWDICISLGPSMSLASRDRTKFHFIREEENPDEFDFSYIMDEPAPLFGYPAMAYQLDLQRGYWLGQLGFHHSVYDTDEIYPLDSNSRLRTVELSVGYKL